MALSVSSGLRVDNEARKARSLQAVMESQQIPGHLCSWSVRSLGFEEAFDALYPALANRCNLILLDQQGMRFISDSIFLRLVELENTDFIFFKASSSIRRFADHPHFTKHLVIPKGSISARTFNDTHRAITDHYRGLVPKGSGCHLAPFSMKKGSNIYGLIFGSSNLLGLEKFIRTCWRIDPQRGEANFDIDDDRIDPSERHLFPEMDRPQKLNSFQERLSSDIAGSKLQTDGDIYVACLREGMLPRHGREVLSDMIKSGRVRVANGMRPRVSKDGFREPRRLEVMR